VIVVVLVVVKVVIRIEVEIISGTVQEMNNNDVASPFVPADGLAMEFIMVCLRPSERTCHTLLTVGIAVPCVLRL